MIFNNNSHFNTLNILARVQNTFTLSFCIKKGILHNKTATFSYGDLLTSYVPGIIHDELVTMEQQAGKQNWKERFTIKQNTLVVKHINCDICANNQHTCLLCVLIGGLS